MNWWNRQLLLLLLASSNSEPAAAAAVTRDATASDEERLLMLRGGRVGLSEPERLQGSSAADGVEFEGEANDGEDLDVPELTFFDGFPDGLLSLPHDTRNTNIPGNSFGNEVIDQYHRNERNKKQTRIIGGRDATPAAHSYTVAILDRWGRQFCGGSLIAIDAILTAAHCTHRVTDKGPIKVVVGRITLSDENEGQVLTVRREMIHPRYDVDDVANFDWDFSVLLLSTSVFGSGATIIKLNSNKQWPVGGAADVTGWGDTNSEINVRQPSDTLQVARLKIIPNEECNAVSGRWGEYEVSYVGHIKDTMMCAKNRRRDSCQGDSGGPLVVDQVQVGITSWGVGCNQKVFPGVYSRISSAHTWIERIVCRYSAWAGNNFDCSPF